MFSVFIHQKLADMLAIVREWTPNDFGGKRPKVQVTVDVQGTKIVRGLTLLILEVRGQRSRSQ